MPSTTPTIDPPDGCCPCAGLQSADTPIAAKITAILCMSFVGCWNPMLRRPPRLGQATAVRSEDGANRSSGCGVSPYTQLEHSDRLAED